MHAWHLSSFVSAHANQARIRTWPRDSSSLWSADVVSFAVKKGLYPASAPEEDFSFSDVRPLNLWLARR